jgi:hypothetical protein
MTNAALCINLLEFIPVDFEVDASFAVRAVPAHRLRVTNHDPILNGQCFPRCLGGVG